MAANLILIGDKLISSGEKQTLTGQKLAQYSVEFRQFGEIFRNNGQLFNSIESIETGVRAVRNILVPIRDLLRGIAAMFNAIRIPTIDIDYRTIDFPIIGNVRFVKDISVESFRPFREVAENLNSMADNINLVRESLRSIADGSNLIQAEFPNLRAIVRRGSDDINTASETLIESGTVMIEAGNLLKA